MSKDERPAHLRRQRHGPLSEADARRRQAEIDSDEKVAQEGHAWGLDPDLAVWLSRNELPPD